MIPQRIIDYIQEFDKENNEDIERLIKQEYGIYVKLFAVYPSLKPNNLLSTFIQVFIFLSIDLIFLSLQIYSVILVSSDISLFSVCIHYFLLISLNFSFSVLALVNRKYLTRMYRILHEGFYDYKDGSNNDPYVQRVKDNAQKAKYLFSFLPLYILFTGITLVTIGPIIDDAQTTKLNITMEGFNIRLPVAKWYPYSTEDDIAFYLTLLGQAILAALVAGVIGTFDLLYITITQELIAQLHILNYSLLNLKKRSINKCKEIYGNINIKDYNNDDRYHRCYYYCIRQNIIHHQTIIEYFKECQLFTSVPALLGYVTCTITIGLAMYEISMGTKNLGTGITSGLLVIGEIISSFVLSYYGEMVTTLSLEVRESLYSTNWYQCRKNPYIKNLITIIQERTKKPLMMTCIFAKINFDSFATVMRGAYSYLNLLSASRKS